MFFHVHSFVCLSHWVHITSKSSERIFMIFFFEWVEPCQRKKRLNFKDDQFRFWIQKNPLIFKGPISNAFLMTFDFQVDIKSEVMRRSP